MRTLRGHKVSESTHINVNSSVEKANKFIITKTSTPADWNRKVPNSWAVEQTQTVGSLLFAVQPAKAYTIYVTTNILTCPNPSQTAKKCILHNIYSFSEIIQANGTPE